MNNGAPSAGRAAYLARLRREKRSVRVWQVALVAALFLWWELSTRIGLADGFLLSSPSRMGRTFAALCDILDCEPGELFEPFVEMRAAATAQAPARPEDLGVAPGQPIARRVRLVRGDNEE